MKKLLLAWVACWMAVWVTAQESDWFTQLNDWQKVINESRKKEDWGKAAEYTDKQYKLFMAQPDSVRKAKTGHTDMNANFFYNWTCYYSLAGKKKQAIKTFSRFTEQSIGKEEIDLLNINKDTDLDALRKSKEFQKCMERLKEWGDYLSILKQAAPYEQNGAVDAPRFQYATPNDSNLVHVRQYFNLDSIAGAGDELSKIKNLLTFVHNAIRHDGGGGIPKKRNAIAMYEACKDGSRGLNCRGLATVLKECYLAMGFHARLITCMPKKFINDCHVINAVYSNTLDKWLWVDPTQNAMVFDENDRPLSIQEVRERLRDGRTLKLNEDANWNNRSKTTVEDYLYQYMAKNLYYVQCELFSCFDSETVRKGKPRAASVSLCPAGYTPDAPKYSLSKYVVTDDCWFWQSPYQP